MWGFLILGVSGLEVTRMDEMNIALHILYVSKDATLATTWDIDHTKQGILFDFGVIRGPARPPVDHALAYADSGISRFKHYRAPVTDWIAPVAISSSSAP